MDDFTSEDTIPPPAKMPWTAEQLAISEWARSGKGNLVVRALAGSGKTSSILEAINHAPEDKILVAAFNKDIQKELERRLTNRNAQAKTLHALGFSFVKRNWTDVEVDSTGSRAQSLIYKALYDVWPQELFGDMSKPSSYEDFNPDNDVEEDAGVKLAAKILTTARDVVPFADKEEDILDVIYNLDILPEPYLENKGWTCPLLAKLVLVGMRRALERTRTIDFSDMIYLPLKHKWMIPTFGLVCIDEAQDMNIGQLTLAVGVCRRGGRVAVVGDQNQCQPAGTKVLRPGGQQTPIEQLKAGDIVVTWDRRSTVILGNGLVTEVASRKYTGDMYTIVTDKSTSRCTDTHKWTARWVNRTASYWVTYLMKKGGRYRVGQCRFFRKAKYAVGALNFGLGTRVWMEKADCAWILKIHDNKGDALAYEQILSVKYGLPEMVFYPPSNIKFFTQEIIDRVYTALGDLSDRARKCLEDHGRRMEFPFWEVGAPHSRRTLFEIQACNIIPNFMALPTPVDGEKIREAEWTTITDVKIKKFSGLVYSLDVKTHHKYVADSLITCNSIYSWRGADSNSLERLKSELNAVELGLTMTFRCPKLVVEYANTLVPALRARPDAPPGSIVTIQADDLVKHAKPGDFVLSRLNAPLMKACLALIRAGIRARILGKDIGQRLATIAKKLRAYSIQSFYDKLGEWARKEIARANKANRKSRVQLICDQANCLRALMFQIDKVDDLYKRIEELFGDRSASVVQLSTVHKAKGLEADRVFVLKDTLYGKWSKDKQEEANIEYVAVTRAKDSLIWVIGFNPKKKTGTDPQPWEDPRWDNPPWAEEDYGDDKSEGDKPEEDMGALYQVHDSGMFGISGETTRVIKGEVD